MGVIDSITIHLCNFIYTVCMNLIRSQEQQLINYKQLHEQSEKKLQMISGELTSSQRHGLAVEARLNATYLEINELKKRVRMMMMMMILQYVLLMCSCHSSCDC